MRSVNNWAMACVFAGAIAFALPSAAQTAGGQAGGQTGGTGQTGGQTTGTNGGQTGTGMGTGTDTGSGTATAGATGSQPKGQNDQQRFIQQAAIGNMAEIQMSQLAQQNAQNPQVKQFAQTMIDQHTQAQNQLQQIASQSGVTLPASLDKKHEAVQTRLSKLHGAAFDKAYVDAMVKDHQKAQKLLQKEANGAAPSPAAPQSQGTGAVGTSGSTTSGGAVGTSGEASSLGDYATKTLPAVQQHLQMARDLQSQFTGQGKKSNDKKNKSGYGDGGQ